MSHASASPRDNGKQDIDGQTRHNQAVIDLLNAWEQEDAEEQRETVEYLMRVLDEDRLSYRRLFP